jgi:hypothetical protein
MAASLAVPMIFFDTDVFIDAAHGALGIGPRPISPKDWNRVVSHVNRNYIHAISPYTVIELLIGVANGAPQYFSRNKIPLTKMRCSFTAHVHLRYTKQFTLREVFGHEAPYPSDLEDNFDRVIDTVLDAATMEQLDQYFLSISEDRAFQIECYRKQAERIRRHALSRPRDNWLSEVVRALQVEDALENRFLLDGRLDACFFWDELCYAKARDKLCGLDRITKMQYDLSHLNYLAAEDVCFVTRDSALVQAVKPSTQSSRVLLWESFLQKCKS